jgi:hypothetical protein
MKEVKRIAYVKRGNKWEEAYIDTDRASVYKDLAKDLESKYILKSNFVTRITRNNNYDGTETITAYYNNGVKFVYTIEN